MNPQAEEWGEERMLAAYRKAATLSSAEANTKLVADADTFAAGAPQHDDMTVVTLHVSAPN
jgi:sigma-B regulation protein RsbU (phosphoserine phosphatase)